MGARWEAEARARGDGDDHAGDDDEAGHDGEDVELGQAQDGDAQPGGVDDHVVHGVEQPGDEHVDRAL